MRERIAWEIVERSDGTITSVPIVVDYEYIVDAHSIEVSNCEALYVVDKWSDN